ncbi:MAG: hypothetical protein LJD31_04990 [Wolbachia endosymbiont of Menacanthus eurysternus]|nr:hypothetical protein [Wolbachia endosymbiont of Menacanthus eurysternus]
MTKNHYDLLNVKQNATLSEIEEAYEKLYKKYEDYASLKGESELMKRCDEWLSIENAYKKIKHEKEQAIARAVSITGKMLSDLKTKDVQD